MSSSAHKQEHMASVIQKLQKHQQWLAVRNKFVGEEASERNIKTLEIISRAYRYAFVTLEPFEIDETNTTQVAFAQELWYTFLSFIYALCQLESVDHAGFCTYMNKSCAAVLAYALPFHKLSVESRQRELHQFLRKASSSINAPLELLQSVCFKNGPVIQQLVRLDRGKCFFTLVVNLDHSYRVLHNLVFLPAESSNLKGYSSSFSFSSSSSSSSWPFPNMSEGIFTTLCTEYCGASERACMRMTCKSFLKALGGSTLYVEDVKSVILKRAQHSLLLRYDDRMQNTSYLRFLQDLLLSTEETLERLAESTKSLAAPTASNARVEDERDIRLKVNQLLQRSAKEHERNKLVECRYVDTLRIPEASHVGENITLSSYPMFNSWLRRLNDTHPLKVRLNKRKPSSDDDGNNKGDDRDENGYKKIRCFTL